MSFTTIKSKQTPLKLTSGYTHTLKLYFRRKAVTHNVETTDMLCDYLPERMLQSQASRSCWLGVNMQSVKSGTLGLSLHTDGLYTIWKAQEFFKSLGFDPVKFANGPMAGVSGAGSRVSTTFTVLRSTLPFSFPLRLWSENKDCWWILFLCQSSQGNNVPRIRLRNKQDNWWWVQTIDSCSWPDWIVSCFVIASLSSLAFSLRQ